MVVYVAIILFQIEFTYPSTPHILASPIVCDLIS